MGKRLGDLTAENTKCMIEVNGTRLIDRVLNQLNDLDLDRIIIVTGYKGEKLRAYIDSKYPTRNIIYVDNPIYDKTNNIYSLWLAREYMREDDTLLLESDLKYIDNILKSSAYSKYSNFALVTKY